jgi:Transposase DNA-binding/Transposase Tn5 dimerisation domain/Transposase DDE domain
MAVSADAPLGEVELGDERLRKRLLMLVEAFAEHPEASIPEATGSRAAAQAAYRFFDNEHVSPERLFEALAEATAKRCQGLSLVLAVQDTSSLDYTRHTDTVGLGPLEHSSHRGLFVHSTLAVDPNGGVPLGLLGQETWARPAESRKAKGESRKVLPVEAKESAYWLVGLKGTVARVGAETKTVTIADREADLYELFALAYMLSGAWVIRARHDRNLVGDERHLLRAVEDAPIAVCTWVDLVRTDEREARRAKLTVRSIEVVLLPPRQAVRALAEWWQKHPEVERLAPERLEPVRVGVVLVDEVEVPPGVKPLRWLLLTSLSVKAAREALTVIGYYRLRWLVERYHYVLKSGCQVERLQLETAERLRRALAVYSEVAWRLLALTYQARATPETPCTTAPDGLDWRLAWLAVSPKRALPDEPPDLRTVIRLIAMLGGFLGRKGDGEPGVKTLWRGLRRLSDMVAGYHLFTAHPDLLPDQHLTGPAPSPPTCVQR